VYFWSSGVSKPFGQLILKILIEKVNVQWCSKTIGNHVNTLSSGQSTSGNLQNACNIGERANIVVKFDTLANLKKCISNKTASIDSNK